MFCAVKEQQFHCKAFDILVNRAYVCRRKFRKSKINADTYVWLTRNSLQFSAWQPTSKQASNETETQKYISMAFAQLRDILA